MKLRAFTTLALVVGVSSLAACALPTNPTEEVEGQSSEVSARKTQVVRAEVRAGKARLSLGFADGYDYTSAADARRTSFCFVGTVGDVCSIAQTYVSEVQRAYEEGDHETINDLQCAASTADAMNVYYTLRHDWEANDLPLRRTLTKCGEKNKTTVVRALPRGTQPEMSDGFTDSSFDYNTAADLDKAAFCYVGVSTHVCSHITKAVDAKNQEAAQGASHDTIDDVTCALAADRKTVNVTYRLVDDYGGDFAVSRAIAPCK